MKIEEYLDENDSSPYSKWFNELDISAATKVTVASARLAAGNTSSVKWFRGIGEYVINWGPGYRIYIAQDGNDLIILFGGGTKSSQQKDIDSAVELYEKYKVAKKAKAAQEADRKKPAKLKTSTKAKRKV